MLYRRFDFSLNFGAGPSLRGLAVTNLACLLLGATIMLSSILSPRRHLTAAHPPVAASVIVPTSPHLLQSTALNQSSHSRVLSNENLQHQRFR